MVRKYDMALHWDPKNVEEPLIAFGTVMDVVRSPYIENVDEAELTPIKIIYNPTGKFDLRFDLTVDLATLFKVNIPRIVRLCLN